jgi:hypothetical protein
MLTSCVSGVKGIQPEQLDVLVAEHDVLYLLLHSASDTKILVCLLIWPGILHSLRRIHIRTKSIKRLALSLDPPQSSHHQPLHFSLTSQFQLEARGPSWH